MGAATPVAYARDPPHKAGTQPGPGPGTRRPAGGVRRDRVSDQLSTDLASLKIDRGAPAAGSGSRAVRVLVWLAVLGGLAFGGYRFGLPAARARLLRPEVRLTEVSTFSQAQAAVELTSSGYVEAQLISRVAPKIPGRVAAVHVRRGDRVEKGALLLELEQADREAAINAARARVLSAQARVATARATLSETAQQARRQRTLAGQGVAPAATAEDLEAREGSLTESQRAAEAEVKAAQAEVKTLEVDMRSMRVFAPISGTVLNEPPEVGELVGTDIGGGRDKVIELADFSTLMVETDVPESRLHMVKAGSPCEITLEAFPGKRYRGEAVEISPRVSRAKATVEVKVKFVDASDEVLPDMSARVSFLTKELDAAALQEKPKVLVPASALVDRGGSKVVYALEGERVRIKAVSVGQELPGGFELLQGPAPGTRLVSEPSPELVDGQEVKEQSGS